MADTKTVDEAQAKVDELTEVNEGLSSMIAYYQQLHADEVFKNAKNAAAIQQLTRRLNAATDTP